MDQQTTATSTTSKVKNGLAAATSDAGETIRERLEQARDVVEDLRERAETATREQPLLVPVVAGVAGIGIGMLLGSRIMRFIAFTAVGAIVSEVVGGQVKTLAGDFVKDMQKRLADGEEGDDASES